MTDAQTSSGANEESDSGTSKITTRAALKSAFKDRQVLAMLILGIASGLPYAAVGGTLNAWLTTVGVKPVAIGLLSWALLAYAFKFMWAAALQSHKTPLASFDIVLAAWRIEIARDDTHLDILSTVEQFGYRIASWVAGSPVAAKASQSTGGGADLKQGRNLTDGQRSIGTVLTLMGWALAFWLIGSFMFGALSDPESYSARDFIRRQGPVVILSTVVWLGVVSAVLVWLNGRGDNAEPAPAKSSVLTVLYRAVMEPMMELIGRLRWVTILVVMVVLSYRFTDLIWGGFAYPFYLGENFGALGHTLTEVGFASKLMGVIATIVGIALGGLAMLRFGRMPVFFLGAVLAAATNLLFADLAMNAGFTDAVLGFTQLDDVFAAFGLDIRMARLTSVIFAENLAVGLASAASIAYLSSIVNKDYAAVQYALLVSLVMLLGVLGRPTIGAIIETQGFARAFIICAWLGGIAAVLALIEWIRLDFLGKNKTNP